jgi:hypothetical protein
MAEQVMTLAPLKAARISDPLLNWQKVPGTEFQVQLLDGEPAIDVPANDFSYIRRGIA